MHTTVGLMPFGHAEPPQRCEIPLWTPVVSFARSMCARARRAGYFRAVRVRVLIRIGGKKSATEPYENPEFV
jgi:hypothetical protein